MPLSVMESTKGRAPNVGVYVVYRTNTNMYMYTHTQTESLARAKTFPAWHGEQSEWH